MENPDGTGDNRDVEVRDLAEKLRSYILVVDKKIIVLIHLKDKDVIYEFEIEESPVSTIEKLYKDQELLKRHFLELLKEFFRGNLELLPERSSEIDSLKIKIEGIKKEEEVVEANSNALLSKLNAGVHTGEVSAYGGWNFGEGNEGKYSRLFSQKLKMIKCYYLQEGVSNSDYVKFGWLRTGSFDQPEETNVRGSEFEVKNMDEMREKIIRLLFERRSEMEQARIRGKKSFVGWMVNDKDVEELKTKATTIGISLSRHISDFFYLVVENEEAFYRFRDHLKCILKWLVEKESTAVIKRIVSVLEVAERDLLVKRKIRIYQIKSKTSESQKRQQERMDRTLELFLREVLCLESILSYPNMSTDGEMKTNFKNALEVCEKEVEKIGLQINSLKKTHNYIFEEQNEDLEMESFEATVEWTITEVWQQLYQASGRIGRDLHFL